MPILIYQCAIVCLQWTVDLGQRNSPLSGADFLLLENVVAGLADPLDTVAQFGFVELASGGLAEVAGSHFRFLSVVL